MLKKLFHFFKWVLPPVLFVGAFFIIKNELKLYHANDLIQELHSLSSKQILGAVIVAMLGYYVLTLQEFLGVKFAKINLPYSTVGPIAFIASAITHTLGFGLLSGHSVRLRFYSLKGVAPTDIAKVALFFSFTCWIGFIALLGGLLLATPPLEIAAKQIVMGSGLVSLTVMTSYLIWIAKHPRLISFKNYSSPLPDLKTTLLQIILSAIDWTLAGLTLYILLPSSLPLPFPHFLVLFLTALVIGVGSQVPGGLGIFEGTLLILIKKSVADPSLTIFGTLIFFRLLYYIIPLITSLILWLALETHFRKNRFIKTFLRLSALSQQIIVPTIAGATFICGIILLFSGATPTLETRLNWLQDSVPLGLLELSHFLGSFIGVALLILARGLQKKLNASFWLTTLLLLGGSLFSLLKGFDYEEASILILIFFALISCKKYFYRRSSLINESFSIGWITSILLVVGAATWLGFFSYKHVAYTDDLWWQFQFSSDAPRFLRATAGSILTLFIFGIYKLLSPASSKDLPSDPISSEQLLSLIANAPHSNAHLALLPDKKFLVSQSGHAFLMYGVKGKSWIAMGDPIGTPDEIKELAWRFTTLCDQNSAHPVFYEVSKNNLPLYLDMGLSLVKLGEEARIDLNNFTLLGKHFAGLRNILSRFSRDGYTFEVITAHEVKNYLSDLRIISSAWLLEKNSREKRFSLGCFNEDYLLKMPMALVKKEGRPYAFANLWLTGNKNEISIDLMRYLPESQKGIMDFLFANLILWGQKEKYNWFNLGMAPLSGLEEHSLAPLWHKMGLFIFRYGENFYNFKGLRKFKDKFDPSWEPRYLASPGGMALPRLLLNIASLVSGGIKGVWSP